jgi:tetratricopeptide (TPR) repeat protein
MRFLKTIFCAFFALAALCFAEEPLSLSLPKNQAELWSKATSATMSLRYGDALELAKKLRAENEGAGCVLENIVRISVYDDKGDTAALQKAGEYLESCKTVGLWDALRRFEMGFVQGETGHSVKGAMTTRSAAKAFEDSKELEARAFFAIYAYYIDKSFSWVPFKSDNRDLYLATLDSASQKSERFWPLFLTPLIWMHYDKEDFATGLKLTERGLKRAPNHPVMLQIKADMLYRLKKYGEAADIYERSAADYLKRTGKTIRYWCSVLNLIRIYSDKGDTAKVEQWRKLLDDPKYNELKPWMPGSLMDDLKKKKLI